MARKNYDQYNYIDPDNLYTCRESNVLKNKLDISSAQELQTKEYRIVTFKLLELTQKPIYVHQVEDIQLVHQYLFEDIYEWAGEFRKVNISKNNHPFMPMQAFDTGIEYMNVLLKEYRESVTGQSEVIKSLAIILDHLNYMHPFREGNGRTQREVIRVLGLEKNYMLNISLDTEETIYNLYMDGTVQGDIQLLEELLYKIINIE
jgi:cell filamentation protein